MSIELSMATVTSADGTRISYDSVGEGPALVLVAGATQYRAVDQTTPKLQALLADGGFTVINYDRRGRGESGDTPPYAPEREFEDLDALVAAAGGEAAVFGMSSGAVLAVEAAAHGVAMSSLVMYEPPCLLDHDGPEPIHDYIETVDGFVAAGKPGDAMAYFLEVAGGMPPEAIEQFRASPAWPAFEAVGHTIGYDARIMDPFSKGEPIPPGRWDAATQPTLVVAGGDSPAWMQSAAAKVAEALPSGNLSTVPGQTHQFDPAALAPVLLEFMSRGGGSRAD
jgi:pimeloyl-ACP methyl ester carboxylesterase